MQAAIAQLKIALEAVETNEPINRAAGNIAQADLEFENAADFRQAIAMLEWVPDPREGFMDFITQKEFESETL